MTEESRTNGDSLERRPSNRFAAEQLDQKTAKGSVEQPERSGNAEGMYDSAHPLELEGFTNIKKIARGGSSVVYSAFQEDFGREVAIKVLSNPEDEAECVRFERECLLMGKLSPVSGVAAIYTSGKTLEGAPYLVLPFYARGTLQDKINAEGAIAWREAIRLMRSVAKTLVAAHKLEINHRDIKPANILLTDEGSTDLVDFGVASSGYNGPETTVAGSPAFAAPEILAGKANPSGVMVDIYGVGATLWALLAGKPPFVTFDDTAQTAAFVAKTPVGNLRDTVPDEVCLTVEKAMSKQPQDRFNSVAELVEVFDLLLETEGSHVGFSEDPAATAALPIVEIGDSDIGELSELEDDQIDEVASVPTHEPPGMATAIFPVVPEQQEQSGLSVSSMPDGLEPDVVYSDEIEEKKKFPVLLTLVITALLVIVGAALFLFVKDRIESGTTTVADYSESSEAEVKTKADAAQWLFEVERAREDGSKEGDIISQEPEAGAELAKGGLLKIVVSEGQELRELPEKIADQDPATLFEVLEKNGFERGEIIKQNSTETIKDAVIEAQVEGKEADGSYETGTVVDLVVSSGPEMKTIPLLTSPEEVQTVLEQELGFTIRQIDGFSEDIPQGQIIRTEPAAGVKAEVGSEVTVVISTGSAERDVPSVDGMAVEQATKLLTDQGFEVEIKNEAPNNCRIRVRNRNECSLYQANLVWKHSPSGKRKAGDKITLYYQNPAGGFFEEGDDDD